MKLYFNEDEQAIDIQSYNHSINFNITRSEYYNITLSSNENIDEIANIYGNIPITSLIVKDSLNERILIINNDLNLQLSNLSEDLNNENHILTLSLSNV